MKAKIVREFEQQLNNSPQLKIQEFLAANTFEEVSPLTSWLKEQVKLKVQGKSVFPEFQNALSSDLLQVMSNCNTLYFDLFNKSAFISEHTIEKESIIPITEAFTVIYGRLFKEDRTNPELLAIYSELRNQIERQLGELLAKDESLQNYEVWKLLNTQLEDYYEIYHAWLESIPAESIEREKHKFGLMPANTPLANLAYLDGFGRDTEQNAKNYIAHCEKIKDYPAFQYFEDASRSADVRDLSSNVRLQQDLLYRIGIRDWLLFIDSLQYLNIQDHSFFLTFISIDDYVAAIKVISSTELFHTSKEYLLLSALQNYFEFVNQTLVGMKECSGSRYNHPPAPNKEEIQKAAAEAYTEWIGNVIPQTFLEILSAIFKEDELSKSEHFIIFFQWVNSFSKSNLVHPANDTEAELIDLLNKLFQEKLESNNNDLHYLLEQLSLQEINFEALKKLLSAYLEHKQDNSLRDKLYTKYIKFISSDRFRWHADNTVRYGDAINNCYYFSSILCSYDDGIKKWEILLNQHRTNHDGWNRTSPDYKIYQRESFLFCAGIGMAYYHYSNNRKPEGDEVLFEILTILIKQIRNCPRETSIDYRTPLKFAALAIGSYSVENSEPFMSIVTQKCDSLKTLLASLYELNEYNKKLTFSDSLKMQIRKRVDEEFELIKDRNGLKHEFDYYLMLKGIALTICA